MLALTTNANDAVAEHGEMRVERIDDYLAGKAGLAYHAAHVPYAIALMKRAREFRANVVVLGGDPYPTLLLPLRGLGVRLVAAHHCVLWPAFRPRSRKMRWLHRIQRPFFRSYGDAVLSASRAVSEQVREVAGGQSIPIAEFFPLFRKDLFEGVTPPAPSVRPFRVIFVGRAEASKGVFDLIEVAKLLRRAGRTDIVLDVCGAGAASATLEQAVASEGLEDLVHLHGWCTADQLRVLQEQSHAAIVPTRTEFVEGFNHAIVEALLGGRPVITSKVCPAVDYVKSGICLVEADNPTSYFEQVVTLADDPIVYAKLQSGAREAGETFLSDTHSYGRAVEHLLNAFARDVAPLPLTLPLASAPRQG
jgi:glycogen(starch) synthase